MPSINTVNHHLIIAKVASNEMPMSLPFNETLILLPTYNEIDNIEKMLRKLKSLNENLSILVIDDGSPDGTAKKVIELQGELTHIHLLERKGKLGLGTAYVAGFRWALERDYQFVFEIDCDFSHDPDDVPKLLEKATQNDLVIGSRYIDGIRIINWPFRRLLLSFGASLYVQYITGMPLKDPTGGFKCFTRKALESLDLDKIFCNGYSFQIELNFKVWAQKLKVVEVPIIFYERRDGQSKMSGGIVWEAIFAVFKLRFKKINGTLQ